MMEIRKLYRVCRKQQILTKAITTKNLLTAKTPFGVKCFHTFQFMKPVKNYGLVIKKRSRIWIVNILKKFGRFTWYIYIRLCYFNVQTLRKVLKLEECSFKRLSVPSSKFILWTRQFSRNSGNSGGGGGGGYK